MPRQYSNTAIAINRRERYANDPEYKEELQNRNKAKYQTDLEFRESHKNKMRSRYVKKYRKCGCGKSYKDAVFYEIGCNSCLLSYLDTIPDKISIREGFKASQPEPSDPVQQVDDDDH